MKPKMSGASSGAVADARVSSSSSSSSSLPAGLRGVGGVRSSGGPVGGPLASASVISSSTDVLRTDRPSVLPPSGSGSVGSVTGGGSGSVGGSVGGVRRQSVQDFYFGRLIGEGSFSSVFLAREVSSNRELAIKVCDKRHILREKKQDYIQSEKRILVFIHAHWDEKRPFFVRIQSTFQNGDLLKFIERMAQKDIDCTQFYAGQLLAAVEFLHEHGILHRDLKPENILLTERMHILITDFGSAKFLPPMRRAHAHPGEVNESRRPTDDDVDDTSDYSGEPPPKRASFVGTAQYVSPEILTGQPSTRASDLWAIGCILYQMCTGLPPFQSQSEYLIFQKIQRLEYCFHEGFDENAKDLVRQLLVIAPTERLGALDAVYYQSIRAHPFFMGLDFESLHEATPPALAPFLPRADEPDSCWRRNPAMKPGVGDLARLQIDTPGSSDDELERAVLRPISSSDSTSISSMTMLESGGGGKGRGKNIVNITDEERRRLLDDQSRTNKFHRFVEGNLIIKQGILDKKKGLWSRRRMFLLTEGPHLYYVDPDAMVLKGEIPWDPSIRPEIRDFKIFFVHTPNRVYYLIDPENTSKEWCHAVEEVKAYYFGASNSPSKVKSKAVSAVSSSSSPS
eukprot:TCALIF_12315-PA protein Name:"Similar to Pdpk1 3-phosphoinositide-dependent protein kinase 1 (Rattus norvegicus)" AED:0.07 eAED:0.07 QI:0/0/0/0.75/0.33/0.25/4/0/623